MTMMPIIVANSMPNTTVVPIDWRAPAPAPVAIASGNVPRMNANDVIRMGRSRRLAPSFAACTIDNPRSRASFANSTMRIAFFAARPISMINPICA